MSDDDMSGENKTPDKKDDEISNDWEADELLIKIHTKEKKDKQREFGVI